MARSVMVAVALSMAAVCAGQPAASVEWSFQEGWLSASVDGRPALGPVDEVLPFDVNIDDQPFAADEGLAAAAVSEQDGSMVMRYQSARGLLEDRYRPFPDLGPDAWRREFRYTNQTQTRQDLEVAYFRVGPRAVENAQPWHPRDFWMADLPGGRAVCVAYRGTTDTYWFEPGSSGVIQNRVLACWRLNPGESAIIGEQGIWIGEGGTEGFRREAKRWFDAIGIEVSNAVPSWLPPAVLYEYSAGGHIDTRFSNVGGFKALARQSAYLRDLGIDTVWLQAVHTHKSPPNPTDGDWNLYDPLNVLEIDPMLGGADGLRALVAQLKKNQIHVLGGVVPHGGRSLQARQLESWWTLKRDGAPLRQYGGYSLDYASPPWQDVMAEQAAMLVREFGIEGVRIDVLDGHGSGPNWGSPRYPGHPSYSTLAGSIEMLAAIRDAMQRYLPNPVIIPENWNNLEHMALTPIGYNHEFWMFMGREAPKYANQPVVLATELREFLERERGSLPEGVYLLRTVGNHDTVAEGGSANFRFGPGLACALHGVCVMIPGIPLLYQEQEIGTYETLRALNWGRRRVPEFVTGEVDYQAVSFAPEVFTCLRRGDTASALGMANLSARTIQGRVELPEDLPPQTGEVYDAVSGRSVRLKDGTFEWSLAPYETALLRIGKAPTGRIPARSYAGEVESVTSESSELSVTADRQGIDIRAGRLIARLSIGSGPWKANEASTEWTAPYGTFRLKSNGSHIGLSLDLHSDTEVPELLILNARRWMVSGQTACLDDYTLRRHFPFPAESGYKWRRTDTWGGWRLYDGVIPAGRLWQSVLEPLHPQAPGLLFVDVDGLGLVLGEISTDAGNIVLTDRTDEEGWTNYGLALRFYDYDPDLLPEFNPRESGPLHVDMTLSLLSLEDARSALTKPRTALFVPTADERPK